MLASCQFLVRPLDTHSFSSCYFHMSNLVAHASLQPSSKWKYHGPTIQIQAYKYRAQLDLAPTELRSFSLHQFSLYAFGSFSFNILGCHGTLLGTSMFVGRSRSGLGTLFENAWDAYQVYFFCRCCTYPGSDSLFRYWIDCPKTQVSFPNQPRKCPMHLDCDHWHSSIKPISPQTPYQNSHFLRRHFSFYSRCPQHRLCLPPFSEPVHLRWHGSCNQQLAILALLKQCF